MALKLPELYEIFKQFPSVETDTRKLKKGDIFFALKGPNFNGNKFAMQALESGAAYAVIDEPAEKDDNRLLLVDDVLDTLQKLAKYHRDQFRIPFIAITGSNGKTTTKELVSAVLSSHYKTYTTEGNLNNHIGIPLTLLRIKPDAEIAVIEMGANHPGEIKAYCTYANPTHGIITNCGKAHLEGFGSIEGVQKAKGELYDHIRSIGGTIFAFDDYDYLHRMSKGIEHIVWYGTKKGLVAGQVKEANPFMTVDITTGLKVPELNTRLAGDYNLPNVLCAAAVGKHFNIPSDKIQAAIENYTPDNSRSQIKEYGTNKIILDAYNANPSSMKAAIENFSKIDSPRKVIIIGSMMELGYDSLQEHIDIVALLHQYNWEKVVLVGGDFAKANDNFTYFNNSQEAQQWFQQQHFENAYILVKGSRSMQMEKILEGN